MTRFAACCFVYWSMWTPVHGRAQCADGEAYTYVARETVWVGAPYGECPDESTMPRTSVSVRAMCVQRHPVSVASYAECVRRGRCPARRGSEACAADDGAAVDCVSWEGARRYCRARGATLLSEAQLSRWNLDAREGPTAGALSWEWTQTSGEDRRPWLPRRRAASFSHVAAPVVGSARPLRDGESQAELGFRCRQEPRALSLDSHFGEPYCAGYSPAEDGYACWSHELQTDEVGEEDLSRGLRSYVAQEGVAWGGSEAIKLVMAHSSRRIEVRAHDYLTPTSATLESRRSVRAAWTLARARGFDQSVALRAALPRNGWIEFNHHWLRLTPAYHTGSASERSTGVVELACETPSPGHEVSTRVVARGVLSAVAFGSRLAPSLILGVVATGGGEGSGWRSVSYQHVNYADFCLAE